MTLVTVLSELRAELDAAARALEITVEDGYQPWAFFGSVPLVLRGIRQTPDDVDVFVRPDLWETLANTDFWSVKLPAPVDPPLLERIHGYKLHLFYRWSARTPMVNADRDRSNAELVRGFPCVRLETIRKHKLGYPGENPKHAEDVRLIDAWLAKQGTAA